MGIYVKFDMSTHQIWSCHVTQIFNFENFQLWANSALKVTKFPVESILLQKLSAKNFTRDGKHPSVPLGLTIFYNEITQSQ